MPLVPSYGPTFRPLDRLTGQDLSDWQQASLFAGARHFHGLHRLYGVADGLNVTVRPGQKVEVSPGVAFDVYNRPLILPAKMEERDWISVEEGYWIVLQGEPPAQDQGVPVPAPQQHQIRAVVNFADIGPCDVPLARIERSGANLSANLSVRPVALRTFRRPYIATGTLISGTTAIPLNKGRGWQVWIDTYTAGFLPAHRTEPVSAAADSSRSTLGVPVYLVSLGRQTADDAERLRTGQSVLPAAPEFSRTGPLLSVSQARHDGFLLTVDYGSAVEGMESLSATPLEVRWMGIEQMVGERRLGRCVNQSEGISVAQMTSGRQLAWPIFRDDQMLHAKDLNDLQMTVRELQWIHNKTLHDWGVAEGCAVTLLPNRRGVLVDKGYALDVEGREIIVTDPVQLDVPAQKLTSGPSTKATWWVTASYRDAPAARGGDASCRMENVPLSRLPQAAIRWRDSTDNDQNSRMEPGYDIILATVELDRGEISSVTTVGRRSAVPPKRPYIAAGRSTTQSDYKLEFDPNSKTLSILIFIDTSQGGFVSSPNYFIQVETLKPDDIFDVSVPKGLTSKEWCWLNEHGPALLCLLRKSTLESVAVEQPAQQSGTAQVVVRARFQIASGASPAASSAANALLNALSEEPLVASSKQFASHKNELKWLKGQLLKELPYQFSWIGIEV